MSEHKYNVGDRVWWTVGDFFGQPPHPWVLPAMVIHVGEYDITIRLRDKRTGAEGAQVTIAPDQLRPRVEEDEALEPLYAVFTVVEPLGHPNGAHTLSSVLIVKEADKPYIIPAWSRHGAIVGLAGENLLLDEACALAARTHIKWEHEIDEGDSEEDEDD